MPDGYTTNMRDHIKDCYQARGLSPVGSEEVANHQQPSNQADQAMMNAYSDPGSSYGNDGMMAQEQAPYGVPATNNNYDSYPDSKMGNVWGDDSATPSSESTSQGGNLWGDGPAVQDQGSTTGNMW